MVDEKKSDEQKPDEQKPEEQKSDVQKPDDKKKNGIVSKMLKAYDFSKKNHEIDVEKKKLQKELRSKTAGSLRPNSSQF